MRIGNDSCSKGRGRELIWLPKTMHFRNSMGRAFTLIELMIATAIFAIASLAFMGAIIASLRQNANNREHYGAIQLADYYQGKAYAADYEKIGSSSLSSDDLEIVFNKTSSDPLEVKLDPENPDKPSDYEVFFELKGWGTVTSATENSITVDLPTGHEDWVTNEWTDAYVTILSTTKNVGQIARVTSNTSNKLTLTTDLSGGTSLDLKPLPTAGDTFVLNNCKTIVLTVRWDDGEDYKTLRRVIEIPRSADNVGG